MFRYIYIYIGVCQTPGNFSAVRSSSVFACYHLCPNYDVHFLKSDRLDSFVLRLKLLLLLFIISFHKSFSIVVMYMFLDY